jgi:hypothetical protein
MMPIAIRFPNANGIVSSSPGLRVRKLPWSISNHFVAERGHRVRTEPSVPWSARGLPPLSPSASLLAAVKTLGLWTRPTTASKLATSQSGGEPLIFTHISVVLEVAKRFGVRGAGAALSMGD